MDPVSALIAGGASLIGGWMNSTTSASNVQAQIQANQQMVQQQEQFQENMSNTAYQRASADMQKAGLNPMMMFGSGGPASTPGGASIPQTVNKQGMGSAVASSVQSALDASVKQKTMDKMTDEMANLQTTRGLIAAQTDAQKKQLGEIQATIDNLNARTDLTKQEKLTEVEETLRRSNLASLSGLQMPEARYSAGQFERKESAPGWLKSGAAYGPMVGEAIKPALDTVSSATGVGRLWDSIRQFNRGFDATTTTRSRFGKGWSESESYRQ